MAHMPLSQNLSDAQHALIYEKLRDADPWLSRLLSSPATRLQFANNYVFRPDESYPPTDDGDIEQARVLILTKASEGPHRLEAARELLRIRPGTPLE